MANIVANVGIDKKEAAFRMELSRLHETVVDLKMQVVDFEMEIGDLYKVGEKAKSTSK